MRFAAVYLALHHFASLLFGAKTEGIRLAQFVDVFCGLVDQLLSVLLPAAIGTISMIYSVLSSIAIMNKPRYALQKNFKHPYKP